MKITDFLKRHSLISSDFIDDFYSFYDEGYNEYDYVINLDKISNWLEIRKENLKRLLEDNFEEDEDYIIEEKITGTGKGKGGNNIKNVMLNYTTSKLLCMLSRTKKADSIRRFYVELEKLLISYKDNIVNDINNQLGIKTENRNIIERSKEKGLIYILKLDDNIINSDQDSFESKIGKTNNIQNRMNQYKVGRIDELQIVYVYITDDMDELEKCLKDCLNRKQIVENTETYKISLEEVKETIKYCNKLNSQLLKQNKKLLKKDSSYLIMTERGNIDDLMKKIGIVKKDKQKQLSKKKTSKKISKKEISKKSSKKETSKKTSKKKISKKKTSKKSSKKL